MSEDLIFITAYTPTQEQLDRLDLCVDQLSNIPALNLAIISHTPIPISIQKKCHHYIYDYNNDLSDDPELRHPEHHQSNCLFGQNHKLTTKILKKTPFYGFAIYRMFSQISHLAKSLGYKRIYHVEYDYLISTSEIFLNHKKFLETWDSIFYFLPHNNNMILGGLKSFVVDKLPPLFCDFNRDEMLSKIKSENLLPLELFTEKIFHESGKSLKIHFDIVKDKIKMKKFQSQELNWCPYYNRVNNKIGFCYINLFGENHHIKIIVNNSQEFQKTIPAHDNYYFELLQKDEIFNLQVFRNDIEIFNTQLTPEYKNYLYQNSYVESE